MLRENIQYGWIEAAIRYAGRFGSAEKAAYQEVFLVSEASVSRHQERFAHALEQHCGQCLFERTRSGRFRGGRLTLRTDRALPEAPVFERMPCMTRWLQDALGGRHYHEAHIDRAEPAVHVIRAIIQSITDKRPLEIRYHSRTGESDRNISPHAIANVAGRLHLRAWDHARNRYGDFVIARIVSVHQHETNEIAFVNSINDDDWRHFSTLVIEERESAHVTHSQGVRRDFGLNERGQRRMRVRTALAPYLIDDTQSGYTSPVTVAMHDEPEDQAVHDRAVAVFGSHERAARWMKRPNPQMPEGRTPEQMLETTEGTRFVEDYLTRIAHGAG